MNNAQQRAVEAARRVEVAAMALAASFHAFTETTADLQRRAFQVGGRGALEDVSCLESSRLMKELAGFLATQGLADLLAGGVGNNTELAWLWTDRIERLPDPASRRPATHKPA